MEMYETQHSSPTGMSKIDCCQAPELGWQLLSPVTKDLKYCHNLLAA
jgi:hypothetical protein